LWKHTFFNIILNMTTNLHCIRLKSCVALDSRAWLSTWPLIPSLYMPSDMFSTSLCTKLGFPYPMVLGLAHRIYGQIDSMKIHFLWCSHGGECIVFLDVIQNAFATIVEDAKFHAYCEHMFSQHLCICFNLHNDTLTLCYSQIGSTL
jgi:hypothetical protein